MYRHQCHLVPVFRLLQVLVGEQCHGLQPCGNVGRITIGERRLSKLLDAVEQLLQVLQPVYLLRYLPMLQLLDDAAGRCHAACHIPGRGCRGCLHCGQHQTGEEVHL